VAGEVLPPRNAFTGPGTARALGLRARPDAFSIVPTARSEEGDSTMRRLAKSPLCGMIATCTIVIGTIAGMLVWSLWPERTPEPEPQPEMSYEELKAKYMPMTSEAFRPKMNHDTETAKKSKLCTSFLHSTIAAR
jgi:hypothetical protein